MNQDQVQLLIIITYMARIARCASCSALPSLTLYHCINPGIEHFLNQENIQEQLMESSLKKVNWLINILDYRNSMGVMQTSSLIMHYNEIAFIVSIFNTIVSYRKCLKCKQLWLQQDSLNLPSILITVGELGSIFSF